MSAPEVISLCVECGPNVGVDEDGLCSSCGATCTGSWLEANGSALAALLAGAAVPEESAWCHCGHEHCRYTDRDRRPVEECVWLFCSCRQIRPRPAPGEAERRRLNLALERERAEYKARHPA